MLKRLERIREAKRAALKAEALEEGINIEGKTYVEIKRSLTAMTAGQIIRSVAEREAKGEVVNEPSGWFFVVIAVTILWIFIKPIFGFYMKQTHLFWIIGGITLIVALLSPFLICAVAEFVENLLLGRE